MPATPSTRPGARPAPRAPRPRRPPRGPSTPPRRRAQASPVRRKVRLRAQPPARTARRKGRYRARSQARRPGPLSALTLRPAAKGPAPARRTPAMPAPRVRPRAPDRPHPAPIRRAPATPRPTVRLRFAASHAGRRRRFWRGPTGLPDGVSAEGSSGAPGGPSRFRLERDAGALGDRHHRLLVEAALVGGAHRLDLAPGVAALGQDDQHDLGGLADQLVLGSAPLAAAVQHGKAVREARGQLVVDELAKVGLPDAGLA